MVNFEKSENKVKNINLEKAEEPKIKKSKKKKKAKKVEKLKKIEPFFICRGEKSNLNVYLDDYYFWLNPVKKKYGIIKNYDNFALNISDIHRLYDWTNRSIDDVKDGESIMVSCACLGKCGIMDFEVDTSVEPAEVYIEYYIHAAYRGNFTKKMASEVVVSFNDLSLMMKAIKTKTDQMNNEKKTKGKSK